MEHFMMKFFGFGIQGEILDRLIDMEVEYIVLRTKKKNLKSTLTDWVLHGKHANFGHGKQVFLSTRYMK